MNLVVLVPLTENMPGGKATKPGDVVTAMNGKTIQVVPQFIFAFLITHIVLTNFDIFIFSVDAF